MMMIFGGKGFIGSHLNKMIEGNNSSSLIYLYGKSDGNSKDELLRQIDTIFSLYMEFNKASRIIYASSIYVGHINNYYTLTREFFELFFKNKNSTGIRFCGIYGKGGKGIINKLLYCAKTGEELKLYDIFTFHEFIYIEDACRYIIDSFDSKEKIIEAGSGQYANISQLIKYVQNITRKNLNLKIDYSMVASKEIFCKHKISNSTSIEEGIEFTWKQMNQ